MAMPPGPFSPAAVEQICRVLGDAVTGSEIPNLIGLLAAYLSAHKTMINGSALCADLAVTERD